MAQQLGSDILIKVDSTGGAVYQTAAGLRTKSIAFNAEQVDTTNSDSVGKWRQLLAGAGIKSAAISGAGVFEDAAADETIRGYFFAGTIRNYQVIIPGFAQLTGPFQIASIEFAGEHNGEVTYTLSLESAGALTPVVL